MMLSSVFGAGPGASIGATNPGSVAQTVHRYKRKIDAPAKSEFKGSKDSKDQHADRRDQDQTREAEYRQEREASLAGQASPAQGKATPRSKQSKCSSRACWGSQKQNHLTNHSTTTHVVNQCGVKPQSY